MRAILGTLSGVQLVRAGTCAQVRVRSVVGGERCYDFAPEDAQALGALIGSTIALVVESAPPSTPAPSPDVECLSRALDQRADERNAAIERAARLAADVARLEREACGLQRESDERRLRCESLTRDIATVVAQRDDAHQLALATALERDQRTSDLAIVRGEYDRLRAELDRQPAHRAAGDAVDLARYVLRSEVVAALEDYATDCEVSARLYPVGSFVAGRLRSCALETRAIAARFRGDLRSEAVEGGEQEAVEGAGGHVATVELGGAGGKARVG